MRTSGVLMPISSLPSPYGIGTMGKSARKFVDFLVKGGQTYWQIHRISRFPVLREIRTLSIWTFSARKIY